jgi:hypothetical protein
LAPARLAPTITNVSVGVIHVSVARDRVLISGGKRW